MKKIANASIVLVIETFGFRICFDQFYIIRRASNFEFNYVYYS